MSASGRVVSVNVARARDAAFARHSVGGRHDVHTLGIADDEPAGAHGRSTAVVAYPGEHYRFWQTVRAQAGVAAWDEPLAPGALGEHLTLAGVVETDVFVGDVLRFADCALAVSQPRLPPFALNDAMGFAHAAKLMAESAWCGWYLAVREAGTIGAGDAFDVVAGPRQVSVWELFRARTGKGA